MDHARAIWALRVAAGVALIVVAFAEKLATPELAVQFLANHPELNVAQQLGLGMSDLEFARAAGAIEILFGLLLISGALPQACILIAGIPFNATLWFFGANELMGHLPIYGAMLALLVYSSDPQLRPAVSALLPPASCRAAAQTPRPPKRSPDSRGTTMAAHVDHQDAEPTAGAALLPIFAIAVVVATIAICFVIAAPST